MSQVPDFANRGKCLNSVCGSGFTLFIPAPGPLPTHPGLVKCVICTPSGCCAAQHADLDMPVPAPASVPQAAPPTSATFNTMQGSRPSAGPAKPNPFRAHAQKRQADVETKFADLGKTAGENTIPKKFHSAHNAQLAADLNPLDSKKRKRPNQTPQSGSIVPKRKDLKDYTVVMVEDTKAVTANKYEKSNANKLGALNARGYVQVDEDLRQLMADPRKLMGQARQMRVKRRKYRQKLSLLQNSVQVRRDDEKVRQEAHLGIQSNDRCLGAHYSFSLTTIIPGDCSLLPPPFSPALSYHKRRSGKTRRYRARETVL
ncbi:hypothetical protein K438DRAFT_2154118 [Mycena galopus ATCC 62051]|nr:hypothetical protein K438DRAFT_2154118 [Mycena galopus ATCC 62051]